MTPGMLKLWEFSGMAGGLPVGLNETRPTQSLQPGVSFGTQNPIKRICGPGFRVEFKPPGFGNRARFTPGGYHQLLSNRLLRQELCFPYECERHARL